MASNDIECPYCRTKNSVKFPCCGWLCVTCGKNYDEQDICELSKGKKDGDNN